MSSPREAFEVVIIGGGIAGNALATVLARAGRAVLVLERATVYRDRVRGVAVQGQHQPRAALRPLRVPVQVGRAVGEDLERAHARGGAAHRRRIVEAERVHHQSAGRIRVQELVQLTGAQEDGERQHSGARRQTPGGGGP